MSRIIFQQFVYPPERPPFGTHAKNPSNFSAGFSAEDTGVPTQPDAFWPNVSGGIPFTIISNNGWSIDNFGVIIRTIPQERCSGSMIVTFRATGVEEPGAGFNARIGVIQDPLPQVIFVSEFAAFTAGATHSLELGMSIHAAQKFRFQIEPKAGDTSPVLTDQKWTIKSYLTLD